LAEIRQKRAIFLRISSIRRKEAEIEPAESSLLSQKTPDMA
jgi:hypothetical protein